MVCKFGEKMLPNIGGLASQQIALTLSSKVLPKIQRNMEQVLVRSQINSLFCWLPGWAKTSLVDTFIENFVPYTKKLQLAGSPEWLWVNATDISRARLRGSFKDGKIEPPLARFADIITIGELMQFIGYGDKGKDMVAWLNGALEERRGSVGLISGEIDENDIALYSKYGIETDPVLKLMNYKIPAVFIACIGHIGYDVKRVFGDFLMLITRWDTLHWDPTDAELKTAYEKIWKEHQHVQVADNSALYLKEVFAVLNTVKIKSVREPPSKWQQELHKYIIDKAEEISKKRDIPLGHLLNLRDWGDCVRTMAAHAVFKQWQRYSGCDFQYEISELKWAEEDVEYLKKRLDCIFASKLLVSVTEKEPDLEKAILKMIEEKHPVGSTEIIKRLKELFHCSDRKVYRALDELTRQGKLVFSTIAHGEKVYSPKLNDHKK